MSITDDAPPTTEERYSRATRSSHLDLNLERPGDVDTLIAAGLVQETLGTHMWRLMVEFDGVRGTLRKGEAANVLTERLLILSQLKTLNRAKQELGAFAMIRATRGQYMIDNAAVMKVTGRVLDAWLDPLCHHCDGRGFTGGRHRGEKQTVCRPCRGCGHRRDWVGRSIEEQAFAQHLFAELDRAMATLTAEVRRNRRVVDAAKARIAEDTSAA